MNNRGLGFVEVILSVVIILGVLILLKPMY
jgi:hypothetical protein